MESHLGLGLLMLMGFICASNAHTFYVGGKHGWVLKPRESYNHWAERNRFQVNDTLVFKYNQESDSVLVVNKDDYQNCEKSNPIMTLEDGDSEFKFDRSGPFFFISGHGHNCYMGQKLIIVVMAVRKKVLHYPWPLAPAPMVIPGWGSPSPAPDMEPEYDDAPAAAPKASTTAVGVSFGWFWGLSLVLGSFVALM